MSKQAVLLIAHGSPDRVEDIPEFLQNISRGRPMSDSVVREVQHRYSLIGSSPLTRITQAQADGVAGELNIPAYVGMRNWHPFIADTLKQMTSDGVEQVVAICLAPHNSRTSVGLYKEVLFGANAPFAIDFVEEWHDHPLLIEAFADRLRRGWSDACRQHGSALPVLFTAHSVPQRTIADGDPYEAQTRETAALVAAQVPEIGDWQFAFQSQGMSGGEWLGPTVEDTIRQAAGGRSHWDFCAADRLCLRSRGDPLRCRHPVPPVCRRTGNETVSCRFVKRLTAVRTRGCGPGSQPAYDHEPALRLRRGN